MNTSQIFVLVVAVITVLFGVRVVSKFLFSGGDDYGDAGTGLSKFVLGVVIWFMVGAATVGFLLFDMKEKEGWQGMKDTLNYYLEQRQPPRPDRDQQQEQ